MRSSAAPASLAFKGVRYCCQPPVKTDTGISSLCPRAGQGRAGQGRAGQNLGMHAFRILRHTGLVCAGTALSQLQPGTLLKLPAYDPQAAPSSSAIAASDARRSRHGPHKGIVAVKVQYPNAYPTMALDLGNVKTAAAFLQKTELKFDLTSAVKELAKQIKLEFDFSREAKIMDDISSQLQVAAQALGSELRSHLLSPS